MEKYEKHLSLDLTEQLELFASGDDAEVEVILNKFLLTQMPNQFSIEKIVFPVIRGCTPLSDLVRLQK